MWQRSGRGKASASAGMLALATLIGCIAVFMVSYNIGVSSVAPSGQTRLSVQLKTLEMVRRNLKECVSDRDTLQDNPSAAMKLDIAQSTARQLREELNALEDEGTQLQRDINRCTQLQDELRSELYGTNDGSINGYLDELEEEKSKLLASLMILQSSDVSNVDDIRDAIAAIQLEMNAERSREQLSGTIAACATRSERYSVVFDAGSTGSRVHVYHFDTKPLEPAVVTGDGSAPAVALILRSELFEENKVPLAAVDGSAVEAANTLDELLVKALAAVPEAQRMCTPVELKATSGLRRIGEQRSTEILEAVRNKLRATGLWLRGPSAVSILDGSLEGSYAWITVNYLLGKLNATEETAAIIDLGGGSAQIVFEVGASTTAAQLAQENGDAFNHTYSGVARVVYQHSYEGKGLNAARLELLDDVERAAGVGSAPAGTPAISADRSEPIDSTSMAANETVSAQELLGNFPCLPRGAVGVDGTRVQNAGGNTSHGQCVQQFHRHVVNNAGRTTHCRQRPCGFSGVYQPNITDTLRGPVYAFSYFYDFLHQHLPESGVTTVGGVASIGRTVCDRPESTLTAPDTTGLFDCLHLSYLYTLLSHGFGFPDSQELNVVKKIGGYEMAWSLGAAIMTLSA